MIKELSNALRNLIISLSVRPIATLIALFIVLTTFFLYKSYDLLQTAIISPAQEAARFKAQLNSASLVNLSIENLAEELNAHSVVIKQFHNGRHDLTGIPFTEATSTFYTINFNNVKYEEPLSASNKSLRMMWTDIDNPRCILLKEGVDISTKRYFFEYELNRVAVCPLINLLKYPIGTITVGFKAESTLSNKEILQKTHLIAKSVTGYLDDY